MEPRLLFPTGCPAGQRNSQIVTVCVCAVSSARLTSVFPSGSETPDFSLLVSSPLLFPHPPFEIRGIRIGDEMKEAERKFLALKVPSLSSRPGVRLRWHQSDRDLL
jgi:hypothetical protein